MARSGTNATRSKGWAESSLTQVTPRGWWHEFLARQRSGLTGHLGAAGYPFRSRGWRQSQIALGKRGGTGWWPFEQYAYWVDGLIRCGLLLDDEGLKAKARRQIDYVLDHPDHDGYLGPAALKDLADHPYASERWPHAVFFRAVMADYDARPDPQTLRRLIGHYLSQTAPHETTRNVCNIEIMAWLYERSGDARMKAMAESAYAAFQVHAQKSGATLRNMLSDDRAGDHGPTYMELFKLGALMYRLTGKRRYINASVNAQRKLERDHVLIDGVPSATEHLRGIYSRAGHETCVITDYLWSLGILLASTKDAQYADAMERVAYNALPGAVTKDFRALQYFSGPNQVVAGAHTNHHPHGTGYAHVSYRPNPATECCPANVHRAMPALIGRAWMQEGADHLIAALYGPSVYDGRMQGHCVRVRQETAYPFDDQVTFHFELEQSLSLRFSFRIPAWCQHARVCVNGKPVKRPWKPGSFHSLKRVFATGDQVTVTLPRTLRVVSGPEEGVGFEYGPLVLAFPVPETRSTEADERSTAKFPSWSIMPTGAWNYGVSFQPGDDVSDVEVVQRAATGYPWDSEHAPLVVRIPARRVPGWTIQRKRKLVHRWGRHRRVVEGDLRFMPPLPTPAQRARALKRVETIELIPYGATCLRVTWFPQLILV